MKSVLYSGLLLFFVFLAMVFLPSYPPARQFTDKLGKKEITSLKAALPFVFGGRILAEIPCTCSGGIRLEIGPPRPMDVLYQTGESVLFSFYSLLPSEYVLGTYHPGGVCSVGVPPACDIEPVVGTIIIAGTSLLPLEIGI